MAIEDEPIAIFIRRTMKKHNVEKMNSRESVLIDGKEVFCLDL